MYKRLFWGYNVPRRWCSFWDTKKIQKTFLEIQRFFFSVHKSLFRDTNKFSDAIIFSGYKKKCYQNSKNTKNTIFKCVFLTRSKQKKKKHKFFVFSLCFCFLFFLRFFFFFDFSEHAFYHFIKSSTGPPLSSPSVTRSTSTLLRKSGSHEEPHAQPALCRDVWRAPFLQQRRGKRPHSRASQQVAPTSQPSRADLVPHGFRSCLGFGLEQSTQEWQSRPTISLRLRLQARPNWPFSSCLFQSSTVVVGRPPSCSPIPLQARHQRGVHGKLGSVKEGPSMSRFLTMTLVETRPPPSLQTCAAARSSAKPLAPRTPASAHAARWWPRQSRRRPHRQVREEKGNGRWRRRHNRTRNGCGSIDRDVGKAKNALHESGPLRPPECPLRARQRRQTVRARVCLVLQVSANHVPTRFPKLGLRTGLPARCAHTPDRCETRAIAVHEVADHHLCHIGVSLLHTRNAIGQWAASTLPAANTVPALPSSKGHQLPCEHFLSHLQSQPIVKNTSTARRRGLASKPRTVGVAPCAGGSLLVVPTQNKRSNHALWRSRTAGILCAVFRDCRILLDSDELVASDGFLACCCCWISCCVLFHVVRVAFAAVFAVYCCLRRCFCCCGCFQVANR